MKKAIKITCILMAGLLLLLSASCQQGLHTKTDKAMYSALPSGMAASEPISTGASTAAELGNMQYASDAFIATLNSRFEGGKQAILTSESDYEVTNNGNIYYVSSSTGNDANDGLDEARAWKTLNKVNRTNVPAGSVILFKRGDVWNREGRLYSKSDVTFSAYGEGAKPLFSYYIDASHASDWTQVGENLYVYSGSYTSADPLDYEGNSVLDEYPHLSLPGSYLTSTDYDGDDIGNIVFNNDEGWGVKITKKNNADQSVALGTVPTGFGTLTHNSKAFVDQTDLSQHLEFYHNSAESRLYLYCVGGNPGEVFTNIKLVLKEYLFFGDKAEVCKNVRLDNLAFKYVGAHGVSLNYAVNVTVQNCEIGFCGGSIQGYTWGGRDEPTRFGEGIQNWGDCNNFRILNNYIHQIYDGATSSQQSAWEGLTGCVMQNIEVSGNCYENNTACIEFWMDLKETQGNNEKYKFENWDIHNNLMRAAGYGFGATRPQAESGSAVFFTDSHGWPKPMYENVLMRENTVWGSREGIIAGLGWGTDKYHLKDNVFVQEYGALIGKLAKDFDNITALQTEKYNYDMAMIERLTQKGIVGQNAFYYTHPEVMVASGAGTVSPLGSGVYYTFEGLGNASTQSGINGSFYKTAEGLELYSYADCASLANDADGNLVLTQTGTTRMELNFSSGFAYPIETKFGVDYYNFYNIEAISIRYQILENYENTDGNGTLNAIGGTNSGTVTCDFPITRNGEWTETVLTVKDDGNILGYWKEDNDPYNHKLTFPQLSEGASIVIEYIGFYHSVPEAAQAQRVYAKREAILANDAVKMYGAQAKIGEHGVRFVGVIDDYTNPMYEEFGVRITVGGKTQYGKIQKYVYDSILENTTPIGVPSDFVSGQNSQTTKFFTFCVNDIPKMNEDLIFEICSYVKLDGKEVCGPTASFAYDFDTMQLTRLP